MSVRQEQLKKFEDEVTGGEGFEDYFDTLLYEQSLDSDYIARMLVDAFNDGWYSRYNTLTYHDL